jgi:hypothetical protein
MNHDNAPSQWEQRCGFSLFFESQQDASGGVAWRTRLYHDESGETLIVQGVTTSDWVRWIEARRAETTTSPTVELRKHLIERPGPASLTVQHVRVARQSPIGANGALDVLVEVAVRVSDGDQTRIEVGAEVIAAALASWERLR